MARSTGEDVQALLRSLRSACAATPKNLKIIDLYVAFAVSTALFQVVYMALVGSFPSDSLPPYPVEQGKQGIQGVGARTCFCRFCSLQLGTSFSDHEFPWLKSRHVGSSSPSDELSSSKSSLVSFHLTLSVGTILGYPLAFILKSRTVGRHKLKLATQHLHTTSTI